MKPSNIIKRLVIGFSALVLAVGISACKDKKKNPAPPDPNFPYEVTYSSLKATILEKPEKVVSLSPSLTEIIFDMGLESRLKGVSNFCDYPSAAERMTQCGTAQTPDLTAIKSISPQVVLSSSMLADSDLTALQQMGAEVVVLPPAKDMTQLEHLYQAVGSVFDGKEQGSVTAKKFYQPLFQQLEQVSNSTAALEEKLDVLYVAQPYYTAATGDSLEGFLLEQAGLNNLAKSYSGWTIPEEDRQTLNPGIVFYSSDMDLTKLVSQPGYSSSKALTNETFYEIELPAMERQGERMFKEVLNMVNLAYPDLEIAPPADSSAETEADTESTGENQEEPQEFESSVTSKPEE